jgi:16S rRNA (guanine1207-N2)-methyltransferase
VTQYFEEDPTVESVPRDVMWSLPDGPMRLTTDRGVFGYDRVDAGTKLLLMKAPTPPATGNLLDLGCGTGAIAITLARRSPGSTVWAIDVNSRARDLCVRNASHQNAPNVRVAHPDDIDPELRFDAIWSNPPIRIGKAALHGLLLQWLPRLVDGGSAHLVVQKHLGADSLQRWLNDVGHPTERIATGAGFRVLHVRSSGYDGDSPPGRVDLDTEP